MRKIIILLALLLTDLDILANVVAGEARYCPEDHQVAVAVVVLNRVADTRFPGNIPDVVGQVGQYSASYLTTTDAPEECYAAAQKALDGEHDVPAGVIYQANFPQGEIWWESTVDTGYWRSTTYFCKG